MTPWLAPCVWNSPVPSTTSPPAATPAYVPRITDIREPGQTQPLQNLYGPSKRVLKQIQPDGTNKGDATLFY